MFRKKNSIYFIIVPILLFVIGFTILTTAINSGIDKAVKEYAKQMVSDNLVESSFVILNEETVASITDTIYDNNGKMSLMAVNSVLLNSVANSICQSAQTNISALSPLTFYIPLGSLPGFKFADFLGIKLKRTATIEFFYSYECKSYTQEHSVMVYKIDLSITADLSIALPSKKLTDTFKTTIPVVEAIIIHK